MKAIALAVVGEVLSLVLIVLACAVLLRGVRYRIL